MAEPRKLNERGLPLVTRSTFLFGATSILGFNLARLFPETILPFVTPGNRVSSLRDWPILSLGDSGWLEARFRKNRPEILLYCHAVCDVPKCEAAPGGRAKSMSSTSNAPLPRYRKLPGLFISLRITFSVAMACTTSIHHPAPSASMAEPAWKRKH